MSRGRVPSPPPETGFALRLYRAMLRAYPADFRSRWGDGMVRAFAVRLERSEGLGGRLGWWRALAAALLDLLVTAFLQRLSFLLRSVLPGPTSPRPPRRPKGDLMPVRILLDLRYACRTLLRRPVLSGVILSTLILGTGGTIAFFGIVDAALLRPLPYPDSERLVSIAQSSERFGQYAWPPPFLDGLRERVSTCERLVGFSPTWSLTMTDPSEPQVVRAAFVSDGVLELFGARPVAGRLFTAREHAHGGPAVAVVSEGFWRRHFGEASLSGQTLTLDGTVYEIVGVTAPGVRMPITASTVSSRDDPSELWLPFARNPYASLRTIPVMNVVGALAAGASRAAAQAEIDRARADLAAAYPDAGLSEQTILQPLDERVVGDSATAVGLLFAAAAFLLLIACANVANLLLARATARTEELAIRTSLGAGRGRLLAQLLTENGLLAVLGCVGGLGVAAWLLRVLPAMEVVELPPSAIVGMDLRVIGFACALSVATTLLFGLVPAVYATRRGASSIPGSGDRVSGAGAQRLRSVLVVAEVALALVLLVGAVLLGRSFLTLTSVDPGFRTEDVLRVPISLGQDRWSVAADRRAFFSELEQRLRSLPGVERVAAVNRAPLSGGNVFVGVEFEAGNAGNRESVNMDRRVVTPGYFSTIGVPLIEGRDFDDADVAGAREGVAIVNEIAADLFVGDPLGQRVRLQLRSGPGPWMRVVGVVGNVLHHGLDAPPEPEIYVPYEQASVASMTVLARIRADPEHVAPSIESAVWQLDDELPLGRLVTLETLVSSSIAEPRTRMLLLQGFAILALGLAGVGIGGVVSYAVARRSRDYGIRVALGARTPEVLRLALREGLVPGAIGAALGVVVAVALSRFVASLLYGTSPTDPATFLVVTAVLLAVVTVASWIPARRATRVDPVTVLKDN